MQDVLADPPFSRLDLVSCRNLLIYLRPEAQAKVVSVFHFALREGGILLLGTPETIGSAEGRFERDLEGGTALSARRSEPTGRIRIFEEPSMARDCRFASPQIQRRRARPHSLSVVGKW